MRKVKISYQGRTVEATPIDFQAQGEHWNQYLLTDGSVIKMKLVLTEIVRVDGEYDAEGNPIYIVKSTNILSVSAPEDLKRQ